MFSRKFRLRGWLADLGEGEGQARGDGWLGRGCVGSAPDMWAVCTVTPNQADRVYCTRQSLVASIARWLCPTIQIVPAAVSSMHRLTLLMDYF